MMQWRAQADIDVHVRECLQDGPMLLRAVIGGLCDMPASPNGREQAKGQSLHALRYGMKAD